MQTIKLFFITLVTLLICDAIWLGLIAQGLYKKEVGLILKKSGENLAPNWSAGLVVYLLFAMGILFFVIPKAAGHYFAALGYGALFGLVVYGIFDFTNLAILANWTLTISLIDLAWGIFLCALASLITQLFQNSLT